ncbi:hypothetical protein PLICRDRAFT_30848 [Plicaturopsis crispa FD-325 SS-3]|nr:hypothetical protein PLICRDRAFT_30848 [Plicaturopsis crispa FD-325 SS-3]
MIDHKSSFNALNSYNVAQLQFAYTDPKYDSAYIPTDDLSPSASPVMSVYPAYVTPQDADAHQPPWMYNRPADIDYDSRRMSSSATSLADTTDSGSILSRGEKRAHSPPPDNAHSVPSPQPKRARPLEWGVGDQIAETEADNAGVDSGARVQLPSIFTSFEDPFRHDNPRRASLPSLYSESAARTRPYPPRNDAGAALGSYQFPQQTQTHYDYGGGSSYGSAFNSPAGFASGSGSVNTRSQGPSPLSYSSAGNEWSPQAIVRPSSTPGQPPRPAAQQDRRASAPTKDEWAFPADPSPNIPSPTPPTSAPVPSPLSNSPIPSPAERPQRKRGKLPKETTDFLKAWLHKHADHPYPSEDEKKQLCTITGLSMSQVSNWMINARRRILAPAHRPSSGPTTSAPYPPSVRQSALSLSASSVGAGMGAGDMYAAPRRASMPVDSLQLYHPASLQSAHGSLHGGLGGGGGYDSGARSYDPSTRVRGGLYSSGRMGSLRTSTAHRQYFPDIMSAPPTAPTNNPFSTHHLQHGTGQMQQQHQHNTGHGQQQQGYAQQQQQPLLYSPLSRMPSYFGEDGTGSGYPPPPQ